MKFFWLCMAIIVASFGFLIGIDVGLIWALITAVGVGLASLFHRIKPGSHALERFDLRLLFVVFLGGTVLGLVVRWLLFGTLTFFLNLLPA